MASNIIETDDGLEDVQATLSKEGLNGMFGGVFQFRSGDRSGGAKEGPDGLLVKAW